MLGCKDGKIDKSFKISEIFKVYKKDPKQIFIMYFIPRIIIVAIFAVIMAAVSVFSVVRYIPFIERLAYFANQVDTATLITYAIPLVGELIGVVMVGLILSNILQAFSAVLRYRALGY